MELVNTLEFHKNNLGESVEEYAKRKRVELAHEIRLSKKIYLDTKYWILLRDARIRRNVDDNILRLLRLLETLVESGLAVCPISAETFSEIFKQSDIKTLRATVQIIDDLSRGITILNLFERLDLEVFHFVCTKTKKAESVYSLDELVWTKIAYVMGFVTPSLKTLSPDINCAMQKAFIDQMWTISLTDMLGQIYTRATRWKPIFLDFSQELNEGKFSHIEEHNSFKQMFLAELAGILDFYKPSFKSLMEYIYESETGRKITAEEISSDDAGQKVANFIYHAFRLNKITSELPSFRVSAGIHAAVRWDKERKYKPNDLYDFHHATDAIPYYDYFLTEHSLRHLVSSKNLNFDTLFHCKTISDINDAINELSQISPIKNE